MFPEREQIFVSDSSYKGSEVYKMYPEKIKFQEKFYGKCSSKKCTTFYIFRALSTCNTDLSAVVKNSIVFHSPRDYRTGLYSKSVDSIFSQLEILKLRRHV